MSKSTTTSPRCATHSLDRALADWKLEPSPYDDPSYQVPTFKREKLIPHAQSKQVRCATPRIDDVLKLEAEYDSLLVRSK